MENENFDVRTSAIAQSPLGQLENTAYQQQLMRQQDANVTIPTNCDVPMQITNISNLQEYAKGAIVRLPDFAEGQPFVVRIKRPSMLVLAKSGKIPNSLLNAAGELFTKGGNGLEGNNEKMLSDMKGICDVIAEASLAQPTYQELQDSGIEITDEQLMAIFNYSQIGFKALDSFRKE